jgi:hypothetical protein
MWKEKRILLLAVVCLAFARPGDCEDVPQLPVAGIYESGGALAPVSPEALSNPMVAGVMLEADWADLEPEKGTCDFAYLDRSLGLVGIGEGKAVLRIGGKAPGWVETGDFSANVRSAHWSRFQYALGEHLSATPNIAMVAIGAPGLHRAEWSIDAREDEIEKYVAIAAKAFTGKRLGLFIRLPEGESNLESMKAAIASAQKEAGERLIVIASGLDGDKEFLEKRRPAGEVLRALHGEIELGAAIDRHILEHDAAPAPEGAEPPAEKFRRAIAFGMWLGAGHFQIDKAECRSVAARPDLLYLYGRLPNVRKTESLP